MKTLIVDFGLVVLVWMTQLVVYPSFTYFNQESLSNWHIKYTGAITVIVLPLMLAQVAFHAYDLYIDYNPLRLIIALLICLVWINTFFFAVPLHQRISDGNNILAAAKSLVNINWYRTALWSTVFLLSLFQWLRN